MADLYMIPNGGTTLVPGKDFNEFTEALRRDTRYPEEGVRLAARFLLHVANMEISDANIQGTATAIIDTAQPPFNPIEQQVVRDEAAYAVTVQRALRTVTGLEVTI